VVSPGPSLPADVECRLACNDIRRLLAVGVGRFKIMKRYLRGFQTDLGCEGWESDNCLSQ